MENVKDWKVEYEKLRDTYHYLLKKQARPPNTVLVPCDKLAEMQAELETLRKKTK